MSSCLSFLNNGYLPLDLNDTIIILIPKKDSSKFVTDMMPISLCNVLHKVVAKLLTNKLKEVVGKAQSLFIKGRLITDNIIVATEINHYLKRKRQGKVGYVALKVDMSKAYDRMEWNLLILFLCVYPLFDILLLAMIDW